ncbi:hypothetical protein RAB80_015423 [Fusarium oxysporum f. sp. vasinfectum]|nr:hypothetical protein RAB80_015423 [Fusarium oxysporum f. sp. vasinfectum]
MPLDANTINDMKAKGIFQLKYTVFISSELAETEIFIVLRARSDRLYISCFPRKLQYDYDGKHPASILYFTVLMQLTMFPLKSISLVPWGHSIPNCIASPGL